MASNSKKLEEANEHLKLADKCLKTGILKWKPDYDGASSELTKAAVAFRIAKAHDQAVATFIKVADVYQQIGSNFHAAKSYEEAAMICKEINKYSDASDLIEKSSTLFCESGSPDTAVSSLERIAKSLENLLPERAVQLYIKAGEISEAEDRMQQSAQLFGRAGRLCIRHARYDDAAKYLLIEIEGYLKANCGNVICKILIGLILVYLHKEDSVNADCIYQKLISQCAEFNDSDEAIQIGQLLEAYNNGDEQLVASILKYPLFQHIENDFMKLARNLSVSSSTKAKFANFGNTAATIGDEEFAEGLQ